MVRELDVEGLLDREHQVYAGERAEARLVEIVIRPQGLDGDRQPAELGYDVSQAVFHFTSSLMGREGIRAEVSASSHAAAEPGGGIGCRQDQREKLRDVRLGCVRDEDHVLRMHHELAGIEVACRITEIGQVDRRHDVLEVAAAVAWKPVDEAGPCIGAVVLEAAGLGQGVGERDPVAAEGDPAIQRS